MHARIHIKIVEKKNRMRTDAFIFGKCTSIDMNLLRIELVGCVLRPIYSEVI